MEERIIDREREIVFKRKKEGDVAVDALSEDAVGAEDTEAVEEEELILELPEEEYDEDLVGLTPTQLKEELARRERARQEAEEECEKLSQEGEKALSDGEFGEAEKLFLQALVYDSESTRAGEGLWKARTQNYTTDEGFYEEDNAEEFADATEEVRTLVLNAMGGLLKEAKAAAEEEAVPLREEVEAEQEKRRAPFLANRKYYAVRFFAVLGVFLLLLVGAGVSASFIFSVQGYLPVILASSFGGAAFLVLIVLIILSRKLLVAYRLCRENELLSATEDGARLMYLENRIDCLALVLEGRVEEE